MSAKGWQPVIGLEVHVQLATASKAFSASATDFGLPPNSLTDPVVLGLPGALPVFNRGALELAMMLGLACGSTIRHSSRFARKHYFYPDLPKGYQISQFEEPLCEGGAVTIETGGVRRRVALKRIHLEEDAGKNMHGQGGRSHVDLNRAGVPLVEVVSEPDIFSSEEAADYMRALRQLCRWLGISGGDMEKGQLRCDANVSLRRPGERELGTRAELKNINSFKFVADAIEHEIARQARILDGGGQVVQETRLWDADRQQSKSMRSKEEAMDYRYMPDPDLPPLIVDDEDIAALRDRMPDLPEAVRDRMTGELGLTIDDAQQLGAERASAEYFLAAVAAHGGDGVAKPIANWMLGEPTLPESKVAPEQLAELVGLIEDGTISGKIAKTVLSEMLASGGAPKAIVEAKGLVQVTDEGAIRAMAEKAIADNPKQAEQYRAGKEALIGYFVGQVMKQSGGKANPAQAKAILLELLGPVS